MKFGSNPTVSPASLVKVLKKNEIDESSVPRMPEFNPGDKIRIQNGILNNYEGIIKQKNSKNRVTILLKTREDYTKLVNISVHDIEIIK